MANFESGVAKYIHAKATVKVHFPVDFKGNADISCKLTKEICEYPEKYVGSACPLELEEETHADG